MSTELRAAETLLQRGVETGVPAPLLMRLLGYKKLVIFQPYLGTLSRITRLYLKTGLTSEQLESLEMEEAHKLYSQHLPVMTRAVAAAILNGYWLGMLFSRPLAAWLRWKLKPATTYKLFYILVVLAGYEDFIASIRLWAGMRITTPKNLSQPTSGS